jgi:hypothetical protein
MRIIDDKVTSTDHALDICAFCVHVLRWQLQSLKSISKRAGAEPIVLIGHSTASTCTVVCYSYRSDSSRDARTEHRTKHRMRHRTNTARTPYATYGAPLSWTPLIYELPSGFQSTPSAMRDAPSMTLVAAAKTFNRLPFPEVLSFEHLGIQGAFRSFSGLRSR